MIRCLRWILGNVILDYDDAGKVVGLEILNESQRVDNPRAMDYAMTA